MIDTEDMNIDELVENIIGSDQTEAPEKKPEYPFVVKCKTCGVIFGARTRGAQYCPRCRQKVRREGGKKGENKAAQLRGEKTMERKTFTNAIGAPVELPTSTPETLDADIQALAEHQADVCRRHNLTPGQVAEAVTLLMHYKNALKRLQTEKGDQ